jgi:hypothetical protein
VTARQLANTQKVGATVLNERSKRQIINMNHASIASRQQIPRAGRLTGSRLR